jgi:hypothetical protein
MLEQCRKEELEIKGGASLRTGCRATSIRRPRGGGPYWSGWDGASESTADAPKRERRNYFLLRCVQESCASHDDHHGVVASAQNSGYFRGMNEKPLFSVERARERAERTGAWISPCLAVGSRGSAV